jgi:selenocysteine-specific elongation factor
VPGRTRSLGEAERRLLRVRLSGVLPLRVGDRGVLRDPGDRRIWGFGVLDPAPPPLEGRGAALRRAAELAESPLAPALDDELRRRRWAPRTLLRHVGVPPEALAAIGGAGEWLVDDAAVDELAGRLREALGRRASESPLDPGLAPAAAARLLGVPDPAILDLAVRPPMQRVEGRLRLADSGDLPADVVKSLTRLEAMLSSDPFAAPDAARLQELGLDTRRIAAAARAGRLLRLGAQVVLLPGSERLAAERLRTLRQPFTASEARQALGTSRRVVLPLLSHLDSVGVTRRLPDDRREVVLP